MIFNKRRANIKTLGLPAMLLLLSACGSVAHLDPAPVSHGDTEQEGGISGTGHDIDCELEQNKNQPKCAKP